MQVKETSYDKTQLPPLWKTPLELLDVSHWPFRFHFVEMNQAKNDTNKIE